MTDRELFQQSLDALSFFNYRGDNDAELFQVQQTIALLKSRLAEDGEDGDEPFLWVETDENGKLNWDVTCTFSDSPAFLAGRPIPLYRRPPQNSESKYKDAIQNCIDTAGGRESEWGPRAESAFAFLYIAIDGGEEE
jgi:hypothetical protein